MRVKRIYLQHLAIFRCINRCAVYLQAYLAFKIDVCMPDRNFKVTIRPIAPSDNEPLARIIRAALEEFGAAKPVSV